VAEIKSALELALEKAERYGKASKEEMQQEQYQEKGRQLAVRYLRDEGDLKAELLALPGEIQPAARQAIKEVLLRNITLPREAETDERRQRALEGMLLVASNAKGMARMKAEVEQIWEQFLLTRNKALQQLKAGFQQNLQNYSRALEAQLRQRVNLEAEQLPQFQEEWRKYEGNLIAQFEPILEDRKRQMLNL
jgi:hypothetical protein